MTVIISMLRGVNVGGHHKIKMDALRKLYATLGFRDVETYIQSGNVIFRTDGGSPAALPARIETAIEKKFGFRPSVIVRSASELRKVISGNPFARKRDVEPSRLAVIFLASAPGADTRDQIHALNGGPEELRVEGRELYIYFSNGMARPKISPAQIDRILKIPGTGRNLNTVRKVLEIAEKLEASG
jgi:uncharacterized protein (DUF1697 family)